MSLAPRALAIGLALQLAFTPSANALRGSQLEHPLQSSGLEEALNAPSIPADSTVSKAVALPAAPSGLEEQEKPERLGFRAWAATLGHWGPTRRALERFDPKTRRVLRGKINRLVKRLVREMIGSREEALAEALREDIPTVLSQFEVNQLDAGLKIIFGRQMNLSKEISFGRSTFGFRRRWFSSLPQKLQRFGAWSEQMLYLASLLGDRGVDPQRLLSLPSLSDLATLSSAQQEAVFVLASGLAKHGNDPSWILVDGLNKIHSDVPGRFNEVVDFANRLATEGIDSASVLEHVLYVLKEVSSAHSAHFGRFLSGFERFFLGLKGQRFDFSPAYLFANLVMNHGLPLVAKVPSPDLFEKDIQALERLSIALLGHRPISWEKVSSDGFNTLVQEAIELYRSGRDFYIEFEPEKGHYELGKESPGGVQREEYVIDQPQKIRLIPQDSPSPGQAGLEERKTSQAVISSAVPSLSRLISPLGYQGTPSPQGVRPLRFLVDTRVKEEARVLRLLQLAVQLRVEKGLPIQAAGVATLEELSEAQAELPDPISRRLLEDLVYTYDPVDEASYREARTLAEAVVPGLHPEFVITQIDRSTVSWFIEALQRLGVRDFSQELQDQIETFLTAA